MKRQACPQIVFVLLIVLTRPVFPQSQWTDAGDHIHADNASSVVVTDDGEVGIGVGSQPDAILHVGGNVRLNLGEGFLLRADGDYWGGSNDARVFRMIDGNSTFGNVDGGMVFESFTSSDGFQTPLLTLRRKDGATRVGLGSAFPSTPLRIHGSLTTGAGTLDSVGTTVFGTDTSFLSQVEVGSEILVGAEVRKVASIVDDIELTINTEFPTDLSGSSYKLTHPLFVVDDGGRVGVGTTEPETLLTLKDANYRQIEFDRTEKNEIDHLFFIGPSWGNDGVDHLGFHTDGPAGSNMMVIKSNGNVGIGTARPASKLVVTNNDFLGDTDWAAAIDSTTSDASSAVLHLRNSAADSIFFARSDGNVGIGIEAPASTLDVGGAIAISGTTVIDQSGQWVGDVSGVDLTSDQTIDGTKTFVQRIYAGDGLTSLDTLTVGNAAAGEMVEIHTASRALNLNRVGGQRFGEVSTNASDDFIFEAPNGKLRTADDLYLRFSDTSNWRDLFAGEVVADERIKLMDGQGNEIASLESSANNMVIDDGSGGDLEVRTKLHVTGRNDTYLTFGTSTSTRVTFEEGSNQARDLDLHLGSSDDGRLRILGHADVLGSLRVTEDVEVWSNLVFHPLPSGASQGQVCYADTPTGDYLVKCSSSRRYKRDVADFTPGLDLVERLRPVSFAWRDNGQTDLGFVAEEVAAIDPLLATWHGEEVEGVKYDRLTTVLVNAVQEQQEQIEQLKAIVCLDHPEMEWCG